MSNDLQLQTFAGVALRSDGSGYTGLRVSKTGALVTTPEGGSYYETTSRGKVFTCSTALTGTTVVAANNSGVAAAAATILSLYNPLGSGVNLSIIKTGIWFTSGTPAAGMWCYNSAYNQTITATPNAVMGKNLVSGAASVASGFTQTALTGSGAQTFLRGIGTMFAGAIAATTPALPWDIVDGDIVVPPGGVLTICSPGTGTTVIVMASIEYQEVAIPA